LLAGCGGGTSGTLASEQRGVEAFHSIDVRGAAKVTVEVGPATSLTIKADPEILPEVKSEVRNGMLVIEHRRPWYLFGDTGRVELAITLPDLNAFALNGAGSAVITGVQGDALALVLQGAGNIDATGATQSLNARINGAGNMDLGGLSTHDATVMVNGAGNLTTRATVSLQAEVNGVGSISYAGNPPQVDTQIHGVGSIGPVRGQPQTAPDPPPATAPVAPAPGTA
jgi:hypothetical protein